MLDNPLSQIERTKDAYMGRPQELQKRANMTKELVDLLAMQQLKKDLDAVKRNQAMQAQGNPATIKDQMQQGLMGEYRQQAAKEMGVGPSEMDTVNRAQQGISQGGPRMPQGAPQQMPQQAQGVMSQARPVQLAGGGIVSFQQGGGAQGPNLPPNRLAEFLKTQVEGMNAPAVVKLEEFKRLMAEQGLDPLGRPLDDDDTTPLTSVGRMRRAQRGQGEGISFEPAELTDYAKSRLPEVDTAREEGFPELPVTTPSATPSKPQPNAGLALLQEMKNTVDGMKTYEADEGLRRAARKDLDADPEAAGDRALKRIEDLSQIEESRQRLKDMQARVQATYDETAPSRRDNLIDLLTAGGRGGITGVGVRSGQLRREEADRRRQLDQDVLGIETTTVELNRKFGADAANAYQQSEANTMRQKENARTFLETADKNERQSIMQKAQLSLQAQNNVRQLYSDAERNRLLGEQITGQNARGIISTLIGKQLQAQEIKAELEAELRLRPKYAELDTLEASDDSDDAIKADRLRRELDAELLADTADLQKDIDGMRRRVAEAQAILEEQSARLGTGISFGSEIDTAILEEE
jgi:hypothetical protein